MLQKLLSLFIDTQGKFAKVYVFGKPYSLAQYSPLMLNATLKH